MNVILTNLAIEALMKITYFHVVSLAVEYIDPKCFDKK